MPRKKTGDREFELLRWVAHGGAVTVGQATAAFGRPQRLSRSTIQTMLERLHEKGHLRRRRVRGVYQYESPISPAELLRRHVGRFVETALGGSVTPFVAYLAEQEKLTEEELAELEGLVERLQQRRGDT